MRCYFIALISHFNYPGASLLSIESSEEAKFINSLLEMVQDTYEAVWMGLYRNLKGNSNQNLNGQCSTICQ